MYSLVPATIPVSPIPVYILIILYVNIIINTCIYYLVSYPCTLLPLYTHINTIPYTCVCWLYSYNYNTSYTDPMDVDIISISNYTAHYYPLYIYIEYTSIGLSLFPLPQWLSILLTPTPTIPIAPTRYGTD